METRNPLIGWMGLEDGNGVNLDQYRLIFESNLLNPIAAVAELLTTFIMMVVTTLLAFVIALVRMLTDSSVFLGGVADFVGRIFDYVHIVFNPLVIAAIAFTVVIVRQLLPNYVFGKDRYTAPIFSGAKDFKGVRIGGVDYSSDKQVDTKGFINTMFRGLLVVLIVVLLSANPFALLTRAMDFVAGFSSAIGEQTQGPTGYAMDMIPFFFSMVNFGTGQLGACGPVWVQDIMYGTSNSLQCAETAAGTASLGNLMLALLAAAVGLSMIFYLWKAFLQGSLFLAYALWDLITVPYRMAWRMFRSDFDTDSRKLYDQLFEMLGRMAVYVLFYLIMVFLMTTAPAVMMSVVDETISATIPNPTAASFITLIVIGLVFFFAARLIPHIYPRIKDDDRATSWGVFSSTFKEKYAPIERDAVTGKFVVREQFKDTVKENIVVSKVMSAAGIDPRATALSEDQKAVLALAKQPETDSFARRAVRDTAAAAAQLARDRQLLEKRVEDGRLTAEQAVAAYEKLEEREGSLTAIREAIKKHAENTGEADPLVTVPWYMADREEFKGRRVAPASLVRAADLDIARADFEARTGVSADDQNLWNNIHEEYGKALAKRDKLERGRATGRLSRREYVDEMTALSPKLDKLEQLYTLRNEHDLHDHLDMTESVPNIFFDQDYADMTDEERDALPADDIRRVTRAHEKEVTRAESLVIGRDRAAALDAATFLRETGHVRDEKWQFAEETLESRRYELSALDAQVKDGLLAADDVKARREALAKEIKELDGLVAVKRSYSPSVHVADPTSETGLSPALRTPDGRIPETDSDILYGLSAKARVDSQTETFAMTAPLIDSMDSLRKALDAEKPDTQALRSAARIAVTSAENLAMLDDELGYEDSDYRERVEQAQLRLKHTIDREDATDENIAWAAGEISNLITAPSKSLVRDFANVRSDVAMRNRIGEIQAAYYGIDGKRVPLPDTGHHAVPEIPETWMATTNLERLEERSKKIAEVMTAKPGEETQIINEIREETRKATENAAHIANALLAKNEVPADQHVVLNAGGEPTLIPKTTVAHLIHQVPPTGALSDETVESFRRAMETGAHSFFSTVQDRATSESLFTFANTPVTLTETRYSGVDASRTMSETVTSSVYEAARAADTTTASVAAEDTPSPVPSGEGTIAPPPAVDATGTPTSAGAIVTGPEAAPKPTADAGNTVSMQDSINRDAARGGSGATSTDILGGATRSADENYLVIITDLNGNVQVKPGEYRDFL